MSVSDKSKINECFIEYGFALMVGIAQPNEVNQVWTAQKQRCDESENNFQKHWRSQPESRIPVFGIVRYPRTEIS